MMIKLAIIGVVLLAGAVIFSDELTEMISDADMPSIAEDSAGIGEYTTKINDGFSDVNAWLGELAESSTARVTEGVGETLSRFGLA